MTSKGYKWAELMVLFLAMPWALLLPISGLAIAALVLGAVGYAIWLTRRLKLMTKADLWNRMPINGSRNWFYRFLAFAAVAAVLMGLFLPERLFDVVLQRPSLWLSISIFYAIFSVYPQEFVYRGFFFARYGDLVKNPRLLVLLNASLFSYAHVVFHNTLVHALTFAGGLLFAYSYQKTRSMQLVTIEHALYGVWLYTIGMGSMLAFPGP